MPPTPGGASGSAAVVAGGAVVAAAALPATRELFRDRRLSGVGRAEAAYQVAVRIPLATALAEELMFRGALLALFRRRRSTAAAVLWTSLLFGAWHVLPTIDDYPGSPAGAGAGAGLAWLRLRSGSVLAPALAHAALNVSAYLAGRRLLARGDGVITSRKVRRGPMRARGRPARAGPAGRGR